MNTATMRSSGRGVTHNRPYLLQSDRRRAASALRLTMRLFNRSPKGMTSLLDVDRSTFSRWTDGEHDSRFSRIREDFRKLCAGGVYALPLVIDLAADCWDESPVTERSTEELEERKRVLHRLETEATAPVDLWQLEDMAGTAPADEDAVDEAILEQMSRLLELYAVRCELRLRGVK